MIYFKSLYLCNMKKLLSVIFFITIALGLFAQTKISVFVTSKVLSQDYQAFLTDQLVEAFTNSNQYIAVNRSSELNTVLNKVHAIQDNGYIDPKQIVNATKQYGETQVCGVNVYHVDDRYVFQASIVDIATVQIIKTVSAYTSEDYWGFDSALEIAHQLTAKLMGTFENKKVENVKDSSEYYDKEIITFEHGGKTYLLHPDLGEMLWDNGNSACSKNLSVRHYYKIEYKRRRRKNDPIYDISYLREWRMPTREELYAIAKKTTVLNKKYCYWTSESAPKKHELISHWYLKYENGQWESYYKTYGDNDNHTRYHVLPIREK